MNKGRGFVVQLSRSGHRRCCNTDDALTQNVEIARRGLDASYQLPRRQPDRDVRSNSCGNCHAGGGL